MKNKNKLDEPIKIITSPTAKKWYDTGFIFVVNYIYAILAESRVSGLNQENFKLFCDSRLGNIIDVNYMKTYDFYKNPEIITSPQARTWYDAGYVFAVNYIYAMLAESRLPGFNQENFKLFCDSRLGNVIDEGYIERHGFRSGNGRYPANHCPGDVPDTCIPCTTKVIIPIPKRP